MREEKREQEEHAEAVRREQMAQELAEAEGGLPGEEEMDDVQLDGAGDLDDEIPEAGSDFMMGSADDPSEEEDEEDDSDEADESALREERTNDLVAARMQVTDDAYREALIRGDPEGGDMYGSDEEIQEQEEGHILDEDDFAEESHQLSPQEDDDIDLGMDADLDGDVPEAEDGGYEHTDSEAEITSSEEEPDESEDEQGDDVGFAPRTAPLGQPTSPTLMGRGSLSVGRTSLEMSLLSHEESSFMDSSPAQARRARYG